MPDEAEVLRLRAAGCRRIADKLLNPDEAAALRSLAEQLEQEAAAIAPDQES